MKIPVVVSTETCAYSHLFGPFDVGDPVILRVCDDDRDVRLFEALRELVERHVTRVDPLHRVAETVERQVERVRVVQLVPAMLLAQLCKKTKQESLTVLVRATAWRYGVIFVKKKTCGTRIRHGAAYL